MLSSQGNAKQGSASLKFIELIIQDLKFELTLVMSCQYYQCCYIIGTVTIEIDYFVVYRVMMLLNQK